MCYAAAMVVQQKKIWERDLDYRYIVRSVIAFLLKFSCCCFCFYISMDIVANLSVIMMTCVCL